MECSHLATGMKIIKYKTLNDEWTGSTRNVWSKVGMIWKFTQWWLSIFYSGEQRGGNYGVGIMTGNRLKNNVIKAEYIDSRLMIRLKGFKKDLVLTQVYMPTSQHTHEEAVNIERWKKSWKKRNACIAIMGNWKSVVGEGRQRDIFGIYGLGFINERGYWLICVKRII